MAFFISLLAAIMKLSEAKEHIGQDPLPKAALGLTRQRNFTKHSEAVPYGEVGEALDFVRGAGTYENKRLAMEFLILTATRTSEVRGMTRGEYNALDGTWTIPESRTKNGRAHRVPLSRAALEVLDKAQAWDIGFEMEGRTILYSRTKAAGCYPRIPSGSFSGDATRRRRPTDSGLHSALGPPNGRTTPQSSPNTP